MAFNRAPKQWCLSKTETLNSFESWRQNLMYTLSLDKNSAPFLREGAKWLKNSKTSPLQGLLNNEQAVPEAQRLTAQQKANYLDLMLGQIANYCPVVSRNMIVKNSTSIESIWQVIRLHFCFQTTGAHFIDFHDIHLETDEAEDLYQRLMASLKANVLAHHGETMEEDEELSPSLDKIFSPHMVMPNPSRAP
jgi:hypothetical protein